MSASRLMRAGFWISMLLLGAAALVELRLDRTELARTHELERSLRAQLRPPAVPARGPASAEPDPAGRALSQQPFVRELQDHAVYEAGELTDFVAAQVGGNLTEGREASRLRAPQSVTALYSAGTVLVRWDPGPAIAALASSLAGSRDGLRLGYRVYRSEGLSDPRLQTALPFGATDWRDRLLPVAAARLGYEVWTVLLRDSPSGEVLVGAERSEKVTVESPEHFKLSLVGGTAEEARFRAEVDLPSARGSVTTAASPGQPILIGESSSGLLLQSLRLTQEDVLTTQRRLLLTTDGSLVLDPITHEPRTTQTQVLVPTARLVATLLDASGATRVLEADLP